MPTAEEAKTKFLKNEITAFEGRLAHIKSSVESLVKQKDALESQIEEIKVRHNKEVEEKHNIFRAASASLDQAKSKFEEDKKEFEAILNAFRKEKTAFEQEKQTILDMKADAQKTMDRVGAFIVSVRNEAAKL